MGSTPSSESRVVLVTGASRGLGRAIAVGFGRAGDRVVVNYRTDAAEADRTVRTVEEAGGTAIPYQADVRDAKNVAAMVAATVDRWGRLDVLVCNAAASDDRLLLRVSDDIWDRVVATTLTGAFHCLQQAGAAMQSRGAGAVILIGSLAGLQGQAGQAPYAAAKAGLLGLMRTAAREWGGGGVRVNAVLPGWHATALTGFRDVPTPAPFEPALGHGTTPDAVAAFVVALAAMPDVSGQVFTLDSRMTPL
ncbi:MAG: SDR family NAD(P)-dependent oxidoreductase [Nitrospirae bacterium]|nr:MAG: SDR family NAD(P)-dependent oxidoreductase [Nitrospirota bacterium]